MLLCIMASYAAAISFDVSPSKLNYAAMQPGTSKTLPVTLYLRSDKDMLCTMSADESLGGLLAIDVNPVTLSPYQAKTVYVNLMVPENSPLREYDGRIYFSITEQAGSGGMSVSLGVSMLLSVHFIVMENETRTYKLRGVELTGEKNKMLVIDESNTGTSLLAVEHNIKLSSGENLIRSMSYKNNILPMNSKTTAVDLNTTSLPAGAYDVQLSIRGESVQEDKKMRFTILPEEKQTTTMPAQATTQPTQPPLTAKKDATAKYAVLAVMALLLAAIAAYLLLRKRRRAKKPLPMPL